MSFYIDHVLNNVYTDDFIWFIEVDKKKNHQNVIGVEVSVLSVGTHKSTSWKRKVHLGPATISIDPRANVTKN